MQAAPFRGMIVLVWQSLGSASPLIPIPTTKPRMHTSQVQLLLAAIVLWNSTSCALAGLAPESVVVVVNAESTDSLSIANHYVHLRQIPAINVVALAGVTNVEQLSVEEFRRQILGPVLDIIKQRGLTSQIRCITYSVDLPTAINLQGDIGNRTLPQILTPVGSINGLTYLHKLTMAKDLLYLNLQSNTYARRTATRSSDTPWNVDELRRYAEAVRTLGLEARRPRSDGAADAPADATAPANNPAVGRAVDTLKQLQQAHPQAAELQYNLACALAVFEHEDDALVTLKAAIRAGWFDYHHTQRDPDLRSLKNHAEFKSLLEEMRAIKLDVQPAVGFRSDLGWDRNGKASVAGGPPYLLSTVLGVTAGRGNTRDEVIRMLERSATADGTRPTGTIYYMRNGDIRSTTREWGFVSAAEKLKSMGVDALVVDGVLPQQQDRVAGAMIGIADFDWSKSGSTILPGAIVEHLTSFGGVMTKGAGQTPLTEFLRHGATGSSGTVTEPYALQAKFPNPFIHVHYASGATLAESFYLSVTGPYQLLIVGDPLCTPWSREITVTVATPSQDAPWQGTVTLQPKVKTAATIQAASIGLYIDGRLVRTTSADTPIELDTTLLADGRHRLSVVAWGNDPVESVGRWSTVITIRNQRTDRQPRLQLRTEGHQPLSSPLLLDVMCQGATSISLYHLGRAVGKVDGAAGTITLQPKTIGSGPVTLEPHAEWADGEAVSGPAVTFTIDAESQ